MVNDLKMMDVAVGEAKGAFRPIRKLDVKEDDNFFIDKSDSIAQSLMKNLGFLKICHTGHCTDHPCWCGHRVNEYYAGSSK
jgi:hypothetical protein